MEHKGLEDLMAILTAGGRNSGEISRALPQKAYGDPAKHVTFEGEKKLRNPKKAKRNAKRKGNR